MLTDTYRQPQFGVWILETLSTQWHEGKRGSLICRYWEVKWLAPEVPQRPSKAERKREVSQFLQLGALFCHFKQPHSRENNTPTERLDPGSSSLQSGDRCLLAPLPEHLRNMKQAGRRNALISIISFIDRLHFTFPSMDKRL